MHANLRCIGHGDRGLVLIREMRVSLYKLGFQLFKSGNPASDCWYQKGERVIRVPLFFYFNLIK
jgi:hypothetical protein